MSASVPEYPFVPYYSTRFSQEEVQARSTAYYEFMDDRRSVRDFSDEPVSKEVIQKLLMTAGTAPSGAHKQPWTFCAISDPVLKSRIRAAAEKEEFDSYNGRMTPEWLEDLAPLGTDWRKPFLEDAPWLIIVFKRAFDYKEGKKRNNYYVSESVGIACGFLIAAIHKAGLVTLTHTPSPMNFLTKLLNRPDNERPFLLLPVGFAADNVQVPDLKRKPSEEIIVWHE
jgi:iodotyrosine deiodinase